MLIPGQFFPHTTGKCYQTSTKTKITLLPSSAVGLLSRSSMVKLKTAY